MAADACESCCSRRPIDVNSCQEKGSFQRVLQGPGKFLADSVPKVTHVVPALFRQNDGVIGGAERYAFELARHMADLVPTTLVSFGKRSSEETFGSLKVKVLGHTHFVRGQRTNPISFSLLSVIRSADVLHCHQQHVVASSIAATICRLMKRKVFVTDLGGGGWDVSAYLNTDNWYRGHLH